MSEESQHGGKREGAGRPKGSLNKRSLEAIQEVAERYPHWSPLLHLATVANDESLDVTIRLDAAKSAAPYCHARLKQVEADPQALIELEGAIAEIRTRATVEEIAGLDGLASRLDRAKARNDLTETEKAELTRLRFMIGNVTLSTGVPRAPDDANVLTIEEVCAEPEPVAPAKPDPAPAPKPTPQTVAYRAILPWPDQPSEPEVDYDPFSD